MNSGVVLRLARALHSFVRGEAIRARRTLEAQHPFRVCFTEPGAARSVVVDRAAKSVRGVLYILGMTRIRRVASCSRLRAERLGMLVNPTKNPVSANDYSYAMAA